MSRRVLLLFCHPRLDRSRANATLLKHVPDHPSITVRDLYEAYPDFNVDIRKEQDLLLGHDAIVWQHPMYWYSAPPLLKQWIDCVLDFGWAYGPGGDKLTGKIAVNALTTGGAAVHYSREGHHKHTLQEFLLPFQRTATLCHMSYLHPFAVQGTNRLAMEDLEKEGERYASFLEALVEGTEPLEVLAT